MERSVYEAYSKILKECPDQDLNIENTYKVFKKYIPIIAENYGCILFKVEVSEPGKGPFAPQVVREYVIFDETGEQDTRNKEFLFEMGNGGYSKATAGIPADSSWTDETVEAMELIGRTFYLLMGRARVMKDLNRMTFYDPLTGCANKTQLMRFMMNLVVEGEFYGYCSNFVNIKNMKLLNNRFSERAGDQILMKYSKAIEEFVGPRGCIARLGGDNFAVFVPGEKEEEFLDFLRHLQIYLELSGTDRRVEVKIDSRVGYYYLQPGDGLDIPMDYSNIAINFSKEDTNPDIMRFESWMKNQIIQLKELEECIPTAIANEEFLIFYQPKAEISDPNDFKLCGAEALVRWRKDGEMIHPGNFIPIIEKNGMVTLVDFYVLEHVCRDIKRWQEMGLKPVRISSNFSRRHLKDKYFADKVEAIFNKYDVDPSLLEIEITESYDVEDLEALTKFEQRMHRLGINLSVDDFGSGFSSLKVIKNIVADVIKLDKSLIDGVGADDNDDIIVSHLIQMIQSLGKEVIAEGVEQKNQADFLRANNCKYIQGYMYARPMPVIQFEACLDKEMN